MGRVVHFEIHAEDTARARTFYEKVFGWEITQWQQEDYWMVTTGKEEDKGINGGILKRLGNAPTLIIPSRPSSAPLMLKTWTILLKR